VLLTVEFVGVEHLPDTALDPDAGPVNRAVLDHGPTDLRSAARWLHALPYGPNQSQDALACLREGHGTCTTKHATAWSCAQELGDDVEWIMGVYALDRTISRDVGPVLDSAELDFVPTVHCFLRVDGTHHIDLTDGNCNGKDRQITDYIEVVPASVGDDEGPVRRRAAADLIERDPAFASMEPSAVTDLAARCHAAMNLACHTPVPHRVDVGPGPDRG
jgi:hypothetical protein